MPTPPEPWHAWMRRLQAIADQGLTYARDSYDVERSLAVRAIAAELAAHHTGDAPAELMGSLAADGEGHPTPKVDVRLAAFRGDEVLLVRERSDGGWTLPGGWADIGEPPAGAAVRELREESGHEARATKVIAVQDRDRHNFPPHPQHIYKLFFLGELLDTPPGEPDHEVTDVRLFSLAALPDQLSTGRTTRGQLERAFAHHADRTLPTEFD